MQNCFTDIHVGKLILDDCTNIFAGEVDTGEPFSVGLNTTDSTHYFKAENRLDIDNWTRVFRPFVQAAGGYTRKRGSRNSVGSIEALTANTTQGGLTVCCVGGGRGGHVCASTALPTVERGRYKEARGFFLCILHLSPFFSPPYPLSFPSLRHLQGFVLPLEFLENSSKIPFCTSSRTIEHPKSGGFKIGKYY